MMNVGAEARLVRGKSLIVALAALLCVPIVAHAASVQKYLNGKLTWRGIGPDIGGRVVAVAGVPGGRVRVDGGGPAFPGVWAGRGHG